jgi:hypothetical protein
MPKKKLYDPEVRKLIKEIEEHKLIVKAKKKEIKEIMDLKNKKESQEDEKINELKLFFD